MWPPCRADFRAVELIIVGNPDPDSTLPYLVRVPISGGLVFRTKGAWPAPAPCTAIPFRRPSGPMRQRSSSGSPCRLATAGARRSTSSPNGAGRSASRSSSPEPGPGHGVLAVAAYPETGSTRCATPDGQGRPALRNGDRGRLSRALCLQLPRPSRSAPSHGPCPVVTMASRSPATWWRRSNASR